jgi:hypothetical protein
MSSVGSALMHLLFDDYQGDIDRCYPLATFPRETYVEVPIGELPLAADVIELHWASAR